jgi:hypothetical protein
VCWNRDFDFDPPESIKDIFDRVHDDFIGFFGEFQKDEYGLRKDEAIRYIYHLMVNMKGNHSMKLIPQSSFTVKSITIDKEVCNSIKSAVERRKRKYIKQKLKKKKKEIKKKKKEIKKKKEKLDKNDLFKSIFIVDEPKNCKLTLIRSNGVDIDFVFECVDSQRKRKFEKIDDSDRPLKRLKNNTNVMVNNTNVMVNNTNVMVNNTNVRVNNTNVMVNERITGVDLGRKDLFVSISHPNKAQCVVKEWSNGQYQFESGLAIWNSQLKWWKRKDRGIRIFEADIMFLKSCGLLPSFTSNAGTADTFSGFTTAGRRPSTSCAVSWQLIPTLSPSEIQSSVRHHEAMLLHQLLLLLRSCSVSAP